MTYIFVLKEIMNINCNMLFLCDDYRMLNMLDEITPKVRNKEIAMMRLNYTRKMLHVFVLLVKSSLHC